MWYEKGWPVCNMLGQYLCNICQQEQYEKKRIEEVSVTLNVCAKESWNAYQTITEC